MPRPMPPIQSIPTTPEASSAKEKDLDPPGGRQDLQEVCWLWSCRFYCKLPYLLSVPLPALVPMPVHPCKYLRTVLKTRVAQRETLGPHFTLPVAFCYIWPEGVGGCLRGTGTTMLPVLELVAPRLSLVFMLWDLPGFLVISCLMPTRWHRGPPPSQPCFVYL